MKASAGRLWSKINNDEFEIRSLTKCDVEEALDILDNSFFLNESVCNGCEVNLPQNLESRLELRELCRMTAEDGVSLVAKHVPSGKLAAVSFNKIQYVPQNGEEPFFLQFRRERTHSPPAKCLMDLMIGVDSEIDVFEEYKLDSLCELMFLATLPQFGGKGIGSELARVTIEMTRELSKGIGVEALHPQLRDKRPRAVTAIFTSVYSQKVGRSQGFKVINTVPYTRYSYNGKSFTERINPLHKYLEHVILLV